MLSEENKKNEKVKKTQLRTTIYMFYYWHNKWNFFNCKCYIYRFNHFLGQGT